MGGGGGAGGTGRASASEQPQPHSLSRAPAPHRSESGTLAMCSPEEEALLQLEEVFSVTLDHINNLVLQPLLKAAAEPSDPWGRECLSLLQQLHRSSRRLWEVTKESLHSLQERLHHPDSFGLEALLLLHSADHILQIHIEYDSRGRTGADTGTHLGQGFSKGVRVVQPLLQ